MGCARTLKAAAAVLVAAGVRLVGLAAAGFVAEEIPRAQAAAATWLTPPYLYLLINAIIISIAASSRFQTTRASGSRAAVGTEPVPVPAPALAMPMLVPEPAVAMAMPMPVPVARVPEDVPAVKMPPALVPAPQREEEEEDFMISRSAWTPQRRVTEAEVEVAPFADLTNKREKPLSSARFGRKAAKPNPEGSRALRVSRPRREDTLESTWKAITEGRAPPLARHLKKSDTFDTRPGRRPSGGGGGGGGAEEVAPPAATMRKAETFHDAAAGGAGERKVRREPSLGQDELNRRVEAFINKFNMEMRLQRQESLKHYSDMVGSGSRY